ncbi:hypothetical protein BB987_13375 [Photorhabdus temperata]|uniref:Uncharacterized protein n=1 Tax=Photorhabdus khanii NC19 TaxID=1004151 RepID=W3VES3_9GAMM|nr:hypothetical protein [Photorhabdus khanii]ETS33514.1 hypothetical protein PTE_00678 [Photorhabdus khanii NC19]OHV52956.1 hypothetical protein BB987_13375 [Photorhabdus temperata]
MKNTTTTVVGLALVPMLISTQAQAFQTSAPLARMIEEWGSTGGARTFPKKSVAALDASIREHLYALTHQCEELDKAIAETLNKINCGEDVVLSHSLISNSNSTISTIKESIQFADELFEDILCNIPSRSQATIKRLKHDTISGLQEVIKTMSNIVHIQEKIKDREMMAIVVIDKNRVEMVLASERIQAPRSMSREEKRKFILQHAS